jgi:hypothetical protein
MIDGIVCHDINDRIYAVPSKNDVSPAAAWYFPCICTPRGNRVFALAERKNRNTKEDNVPLCRRLDRRLRKSCQ